MTTIKYKAVAFKLSKEVNELLKSAKQKSGKTWNLFFKELLKK